MLLNDEQVARATVMSQFERQAAALAVRLLRDTLPEIPIRYAPLEDVMAQALARAQAATRGLVVTLGFSDFDAETALARAEKGWLKAMDAVKAALRGGARTRRELVAWLKIALDLKGGEIDAWHG